MFGIAIGTKSFDVYIEFSVRSHFKLLGLTENEKDRGIFCPHFVQLSNSVSIRTIRLFHNSLPPQFLSDEKIKYCLSGMNAGQVKGLLSTPVMA